jgi:peptide/nickel transport system substrate-binding protein
MNRLAVASFVACLTVLQGCAPEGRAKQPPALKIRLMADPGTLDPQQAYNGAGAMAAPFSYDRLVINDDGVIRPQLARAWRVAGAQVTLWLRPDAVCQDGAKLTADMVLRNFHRLLDPATRTANAASIFGSTHVAMQARASDNRVELRLDQPYGDILYGLTRVPIVCAGGLADLNRLKSAPDGTGPFRLVDALAGDHYTFERRRGYRWGLGGASTDASGFPQRVELKIVENDTTAANMLLSGELDIARIIGPDRRRLAGRGFVQREVSPALYSLFYNQHPGRPGQSLALRRALAEALDRTQVARAAMGADASAATSFLVPAAPCFDPDNRRRLPAFDLKAALADLKLAGFDLVNGELRNKGEPVRLVVVTPSDFALVGDVLAEAWSKLGLHPIIRTETEAQITQTTFLGGDWDVVVDNTDPTITGRNVQFFDGDFPPKGLDFTYNRDPRYAQLTAAARREIGGCQAWRAANARLLDRVVLTPLFFGRFQWFGRATDFKPVFNEQAALEPSVLRWRP